jgi:hypothetical protein
MVGRLSLGMGVVERCGKECGIAHVPRETGQKKTPAGAEAKRTREKATCAR